MNKFINYETQSINYKSLAEPINLCKRPIETTEEYVQWVREWKQLHKELIQAIRYFRKQRNKAKKLNQSDVASLYWNRKLIFKPTMRMMYEQRVERKAALKQGKYTEVELTPA